MTAVLKKTFMTLLNEVRSYRNFPIEPAENVEVKPGDVVLVLSPEHAARLLTACLNDMEEWRQLGGGGKHHVSRRPVPDVSYVVAALEHADVRPMDRQ